MRSRSGSKFSADSSGLAADWSAAAVGGMMDRRAKLGLVLTGIEDKQRNPHRHDEDDREHGQNNSAQRDETGAIRHGCLSRLRSPANARPIPIRDDQPN